MSLISRRKFIKTGLASLATSAIITPEGHFCQDSYASKNVIDPLGPNQPIGLAKGVCPGRVVWVYDPDATNENCQPGVWEDGYYLDKNCDQSVVDDMFSKGIRKLTEKDSDAEAWDAIFRNFNQSHNKGNAAYSDNETIFIKVNAVHTNTRNFGPDGSIIDSKQYGYVDTSPHAIMAILRQLVNEAGVPEENIYIGDPMLRNFFKHSYDKFSAEFPNINYMSLSGLPGRTMLVESDTIGIHFSDRGTVMDETHDYYYNCLMNADYLINIPAMKGHPMGGVTFFAKNHFGSHTRINAAHLHKGLQGKPDGDPLRTGYNKYRVFVDLMGGENLGGKTLLYYMDALWSTSEAHLPPTKFLSAPFNNDWSSSLFLSLDPVAISSVCLDVMRAEFKEEDLDADPPRHTHVQWPGLDDYLHQAASSEWWPEGIVYDPDNNGTPITSLGVHEHWNNAADMEYSRNLGTGEGIELSRIFQITTSVKTIESINPNDFVLYNNYPNPFNPITTIEYSLRQNGRVTLAVYNTSGQLVTILKDKYQTSGNYSITWNADRLPSGLYFYTLKTNGFTEMKKMLLVK